MNTLFYTFSEFEASFCMGILYEIYSKQETMWKNRLKQETE